MMQLLTSQVINASVDGPTIDLQTATNFHVTIIWTGSPVGTVRLEKSDNGNTWAPIVGSSQTLGGTSGSHMIDYSGAGFQFIRLAYTHTSGTGAMSAIGNIKQPFVMQ